MNPILAYSLLTVSVIMFGLQFFFNSGYQKEGGNDMIASMILTLLSSLAGVVCLAIINGFDFYCTWFTLLMAALTALNSFLFTVCSLKSLAKINLSLYSLFSMLGGMMLPFVAGLLFFDESMTLGKALCLVFVIAALALTVNKGTNKGGVVYYCGIFILNGMSGVLSTIYQRSAYEKATAAGYSLWSALISVAVAGVYLAFVWRKVRKPSWKAVAFAVGGGTLSRVAGYILLLSLAVLPASIQYPFITGGVMIVSTVIAAIAGQKPSKKEILSVVLAFVGVLVLVLVPV